MAIIIGQSIRELFDAVRIDLVDVLRQFTQAPHLFSLGLSFCPVKNSIDDAVVNDALDELVSDLPFSLEVLDFSDQVFLGLTVIPGLDDASIDEDLHMRLNFSLTHVDLVLLLNVLAELGSNLVPDVVEMVTTLRSFS